MIERFGAFNIPRTKELQEKDATISGPEAMLSSQEIFAQPVETTTEDLAPGVCFEQQSVILAEGDNFTNRYRVVLNSDSPDISFGVDTKTHTTHLKRTLVNDESVVCAINGGFFLLVDETPEHPPRELQFGTVVRDGVIHGLQSHDRPVLWVDKEGDLHVSEVSARGEVTIEGVPATWVGSQSSHSEGDFILFGADCAVIEHVADAGTGKKRIINEQESKTPQGTELVDLVCSEQNGRMVVEEIVHGGGSPVTAGNFILQGRAVNLAGVTVGQEVDISYSDLNSKEVTSAITIGPSVAHFDTKEDHPINDDTSLGDEPPFSDRRMARSIIYKTQAGKIVFELFDGAPKSDLFKGVTPKEVGQILKEDAIEMDWAYFLDPGQSARLAVRHSDGSVEGFGNQHYVRWPKLPNHPYVWAGEHGRAIPSVVSAKIKQHDK